MQSGFGSIRLIFVRTERSGLENFAQSKIRSVGLEQLLNFLAALCSFHAHDARPQLELKSSRESEDMWISTPVLSIAFWTARN